MKTRLIHPIGKRLHVLLDNGHTHTFKHIFPLSVDLHDNEVLHSDDYKTMMRLKRVGWGLRLFYDNETGVPQPGDMFWRDCYMSGPTNNFDWDNSDGKDLIVICPNGMEWNIDSRARNCTMKEDRTHRCWVRTGTPPDITVGKGGHTCSAGAGSIKVGDYHGFLRNGKFTNC